MSGATVRACLVLLLITASEGTVSSIFSPFLDGIGLSLTDIGIVTAVYAIVGLFTRIPSGVLFQRWGGTWMMRVSLVLLAVSVAGYGLAVSGEWVLLARIIHGFAFALSTTVNFAQFLGLAAKDSKRGRSMGVFAASQSGGRSVGNFLGGYLADQLGFSGAFIIAAVFPILALLILPRRGSAEDRPVRVAASGATETTRSFGDKLRLVGNAGVLTQTILGFSYVFMYHLEWIYFPLYGLSAGLSMTSIGALKAMNSVFGVVTRPFTGEIVRGLGYNFVTNVGIILGAFFITVIPSFQDFWPLAIVLLTGGVIRGAITVTNGLALIEAAEEDPGRRGMASAVYNTGQDLGAIVGPIVGGVVAAYIGIPDMLRFAPWLVLGVYGLLMLMARLQRRQAAPMPS